MKKPNISRRYRHKTAVMVQASVLAVVGLVLTANALVQPWAQFVSADTYDNQIQALRDQNANAQAAANNLQTKIDSYQAAVNSLQSEIANLQQQIDANVAQQQTLQQKIADDQAQLDRQRAMLASDVKAMYVDGTPSELEVLATSKNLSDFVDKQEYRNSVQKKLQETMARIAELQRQLQQQKQKVDQLLNEQRTQQTQLAADQQQQASLLAMSQSEQDAYTRQIQSNNSQIASLQAQQWAAYQQLTGGGARNYGAVGKFQFRNQTREVNCGGGYSYCWAGYDQYVYDPWGLGLARECVHYAADRAAHDLNLKPYFGRYWGAGNAENWPDALGGAFTVDHNPVGGHVVAIVAWPTGSGHAMYVESVLPDGWVHVSQMNWGVSGSYSEMDIKASGVLFIHFP